MDIESSAFGVQRKTHELDQARDVIMRYGWNAMSYQLLNPTIRRWWSAQGDAVVGYEDAGGYWVVAGAPVASDERLPVVVAEFQHAAARVRRRVCYFGAQQRLIDVLAEGGPLATIVLGAQPVWHPANWPHILAGKSSLRAQLARARNKGVTVVEWDAERATNHPALRRCLREWLATRGLPPMHFLVEPETLAYLRDRQVYVAERAGTVVGFLIASPVPLRDGWLVEQIIRGASAPNGTAELLLDAAMRGVIDDGATYVTLGLSPLSHAAGMAQSPQTLLMQLLLSWTRAHGRRFYNFEGLDRFKAKFMPDEWEPVYAAANARRPSLRMMYAIAGAFGGRSPLLFVGHALLRAAWQEVRWARRYVSRSGKAIKR